MEPGRVLLESKSHGPKAYTKPIYVLHSGTTTQSPDFQLQTGVIVIYLPVRSKTDSNVAINQVYVNDVRLILIRKLIRHLLML